MATVPVPPRTGTSAWRTARLRGGGDPGHDASREASVRTITIPGCQGGRPLRLRTGLCLVGLVRLYGCNLYYRRGPGAASGRWSDDRPPRPEDFDPRSLVGQDWGEACCLLREIGWFREAHTDRPVAVPRSPQRESRRLITEGAPCDLAPSSPPPSACCS
jgi:hypothetical protein